MAVSTSVKQHYYTVCNITVNVIQSITGAEVSLLEIVSPNWANMLQGGGQRHGSHSPVIIKFSDFSGYF